MWSDEEDFIVSSFHNVVRDECVELAWLISEHKCEIVSLWSSNWLSWLFSAWIYLENSTVFLG